MERKRLFKKYKPEKIGYKKALKFSKQIQNILKKYKPIIVGSVRRKKDLIKDLDFLIFNNSKCLDKIYPILSKHLECYEYSSGPCRKSLMVVFKTCAMPVDFFFAKKEHYAFAMVHHTGNSIFNIHLRALANKKGYKLNQYGIWKGDRRAYGSSKIKTEKDLFNFLKISDHSPEERSK